MANLGFSSVSSGTLMGGAPTPVEVSSAHEPAILPLLPMLPETVAKLNEVGKQSISSQEKGAMEAETLSAKPLTLDLSDQTTRKTVSCFQKFIVFLKKTYDQMIACLELLITTNRNYVYDEEMSEAYLAQKNLDKLSKQLKVKGQHLKIEGLKNITGNNCYMNAGLQLIASFLKTDEAYLKLIRKPLVKEKNQSLVDFENQVLYKWSPLVKESMETDEQFESRILFKWSFLVLMQAKNYSDTKKIEAALKQFHHICFHLGLTTVFHSGNDRDQHDIAEFLTLWSSVLRISSLATYARSRGSHEGRELFGEAKIQPMPLIPVPVRGDEHPAVVQDIKSKCDEDIDEIEKNYRDRLAEKEEEIKKNKRKLRSLKRKLRGIKDKSGKVDKQKLEEGKKRRKAKISSLGEETNRLKVEFAQEIRNRRAQAREEMAAFDVFDAEELLAHLAINEDIKGLEFEDEEGRKIVADGYREYRLSPLNGQLPNGFFIQFKRFDLDDQRRPIKINGPIDFTKAMKVNLKGYLVDDLKFEDDECQYEITSFSEHWGGSGKSGHYVSYVKKDNRWYKCNDKDVVWVKEPPIQNAYICCYQKVKKLES
ncbi:MAG: ubiquitin carboxyl-terminal hydrolase [Parachlamydiaceae bacterium]